jgi:nicotinamide mononucleotide adenylyltransferase
VIQNDISSTKVRLFLKKDLSVRYLIPDPVVEVCHPSRIHGRTSAYTRQYIEEHQLFSEPNPNKSRSRTPEVAAGPSNPKAIKG